MLSLACSSGLRAQDTLSLTIEEAVQTALSQNPTVRAAREQVAAAGAGVRGACAERLPRVDASAEYVRITSVPSFEIPPTVSGELGELTVAEKENTTGTIVARQALYTGGRVPAQITRAEALFDAALGQLGAVEAEVALRTREAFYGVLLGKSLVESAEQNLAAAREQLDAANAKFDAGTAPRFDVLRAQTQVSEAQQGLVEARNQVKIAEVTLNRVLGVPLASCVSLSEPAPASFPKDDLPSLIETAGDRRAELLAARAELAASEAGIRLAGSERLPQLGLEATYQAVGKETVGQVTGWTLMAVASMEIFDAGRTRANIGQARSLRDEARANLEDAERGVEQDVRQAYLNLQTAGQTLETAGTRLAQAEEAYEVATVRYESGVGTAVELADALAALTAARTNLDEAGANRNIAYARLQRAVGRTTY